MNTKKQMPRLYLHHKGYSSYLKREMKKIVSMTANTVFGPEKNLAKYLESIHIYPKRRGDSNRGYLLKGLSEIYNPKTKRMNIQSGGFYGRLSWALAHDIAHVFDIVHKNLIFEKNSIVWMGARYEIPEDYKGFFSIKKVRLPEYNRGDFRGSREYAAENFLYPWELKAVMLADVVHNEYLEFNNNHKTQKPFFKEVLR